MGGSLKAPSRRRHVGGEVGLTTMGWQLLPLPSTELEDGENLSAPISPSLPLPANPNSLCGMGKEPQTHAGPSLQEVTVSSRMQPSLA